MAEPNGGDQHLNPILEQRANSGKDPHEAENSEVQANHHPSDSGDEQEEISNQYEDNPMENEVPYAKTVRDGELVGNSQNNRTSSAKPAHPKTVDFYITMKIFTSNELGLSADSTVINPINQNTQSNTQVQKSIPNAQAKQCQISNLVNAYPTGSHVEAKNSVPVTRHVLQAPPGNLISHAKPGDLTNQLPILTEPPKTINDTQLDATSQALQKSAQNPSQIDVSSPTAFLKAAALAVKRQYLTKDSTGRCILPQQPSKPNHPLSAAPYPSLPQVHQIQELIHSCDTEISQLRSKQSYLEHKKIVGIITVPPTSSRNPEHKIQDYRGFMISHNFVNSIEDQSKMRASRAAELYQIKSINQKYAHVSQLPEYTSNITKHEEMLDPMFRVVTAQRSIVHENALNYTREYLERRQQWEEYYEKVNQYHNESRRSINLWPPEFSKCVLKTNESLLLQYVAHDQPMYLDHAEREEYCYYDMNRFVPDPVASHLAYKNRLVWTEQEIHTFLEKYVQHPRDFKKIAAALPAKSVKDVIEYYNIHRIRLNLKDIEMNSRNRRGGRKKMITEGSVRNK